MRKELYTKIAERYKQRYEAFEKLPGFRQNSNLKDAFNSVYGLEWYASKMNNPESTNLEEIKHLFLFELRTLRIYFKLLQKYPEFREAEMARTEGYFPDLFNFVCSEEGMLEQRRLFGESPRLRTHYVLLSRRRLESGAQSAR